MCVEKGQKYDILANLKWNWIRVFLHCNKHFQNEYVHPNMPASIERRVDILFSLVFFKSNTVKVQEEIGKGIFGVGIIFFHYAFKWT